MQLARPASSLSLSGPSADTLDRLPRFEPADPSALALAARDEVADRAEVGESWEQEIAAHKAILASEERGAALAALAVQIAESQIAAKADFAAAAARVAAREEESRKAALVAEAAELRITLGRAAVVALKAARAVVAGYAKTAFPRSRKLAREAVLACDEAERAFAAVPGGDEVLAAHLAKTAEILDAAVKAEGAAEAAHAAVRCLRRAG
jgi:hypothetical protein